MFHHIFLRVFNKESLISAGNVFLVVGMIFLLSYGIISYSRDVLARHMWQQYGNAYGALVLVQNDKNLALELGNHYYNTPITIDDGKVILADFDIQKAKVAFSIALQSEKPPMWAHYQLGRIYFTEARFEDALKEFHEELRLYPDNTRTKYMFGLVYGYRDQPGDDKLAEENFRAVIEWIPQRWGAYNDLAWVFLKNEKYQEAKELAQKGIDTATDGDTNPWLLNSLGVATLNLKEKEDAIQAFTQASLYAEKLSLEEWGMAYTGNGPPNQGTLDSFRDGILQNLEKAKDI